MKKRICLLLAVFMIISTLPFTAAASGNTANNIKSISATPVITQLLELYDGYDNGEFFEYFEPEYSLTVYFEDGTEKTYDYSWEAYYDFGENAICSSDQSEENQWGIGTHTFTVSLLGIQTQFDVEVIENPVSDISATPYNPQIMEYTYGYDNGEYFRYYAPNYSITVYLKDGTERTYDSPWEIYEDFGESISESSDQSVENQWGIGFHTFELSFLGASTQLNIEIIENPVSGISATPYNPQIIEYTNGYDNGEFFEYSAPDFSITVYFKDGTEKTYDYSWEIYEDFGESISESSDQSEENQWGIGFHTFELSFLGVSTQFNVEIIENPLSGISVTPKKTQLIECVDGHMSVETFIYSEPEFSLTLHFKDGTEKTYEDPWDVYSEYNESLSIGSNQWEEPWGLGSHYFDISFLGHKTRLNVEVIENPVSGIEVISAPADNYLINGETANGIGAKIKISYTNGTNKTFTLTEEMRGRWPDKFSFDGYPIQFSTAFGNIVYVEYMNRITEYTTTHADIDITGIRFIDTYSCLSLDGKRLELTYSDKTVKTVTILKEYTGWGEEAMVGGYMITTDGIFQFEKIHNEASGAGYQLESISYSLGKATIDISPSAYQKTEYLVDNIMRKYAIFDHFEGAEFNGRITKENADLLMTGFIWRLEENNSDNMKSILREAFEITGEIDVNLCTFYNPDEDVFELDGYGDIVTTSGRLLEENNNGYIFRYTSKNDTDTIEYDVYVNNQNKITAIKTVKEAGELFGDANNDGTVDIKDLIRLKKLISSDASASSNANADLNRDNKLDSIDLILIKTYLLYK